MCIIHTYTNEIYEEDIKKRKEKKLIRKKKVYPLNSMGIPSPPKFRPSCLRPIRRTLIRASSHMVEGWITIIWGLDV